MIVDLKSMYNTLEMNFTVNDIVEDRVYSLKIICRKGSSQDKQVIYIQR